MSTYRPTRPHVLRTAALIVAGAAACHDDRRATTPLVSSFRDDFGDTIAVGGMAPRRVVSLNPAATVMLFAMGDGWRLVGRTRWDDDPPAVRAVASLGDGLRPNVEAVLATRPDLVILYANNDDRDAVRQLRAAGVPTLTLRDDRLADFRRVLQMIGRAVHDSARAAAVGDSVARTLARVRASTAGVAPVSVVWEAESSPVRVLGGGSYLTELVADAGGRNLYGDIADPSPEVSLEDILRRDPDVVLTSKSGARQLRVDRRWRTWLDAPGHRLLVPDSALVGMPSVHMGEAAAELATLLHPELVR